MEWIRDKRRPELIEKRIGFGKSKKVLALINDVEPIVVEYNKGIGEVPEWEQWYCPAYEDVVEGVTGWCDCIPDYNA